MRNPKDNRVKARLPRGFADRGAAEIKQTLRMIERIRAVYERYGFDPVETPAIEYTDALGKFLPDQDRPNEGVFSFQDDDEQWLSLRYDLTAPLARYVAENFQNVALPYRSYRFGWVFRNEKPGPGRFRQFMQFDADTVGAATMAADAEICMMAADTMEALGVPRGSYVVKVNNRKVLDGVLETIGLGGEANAGRRLTVLRAIDKFDRLGEQGVRLLVGAGRKDESGDFTRGAELTDEHSKLIIEYIRAQQFTTLEYVGSDSSRVVDNRGKLQPFETAAGEPAGTFRVNNEVTIQNLRKSFGRSAIALAGIDELEQIANLARASGYTAKRIVVDSSVVRGLEYY